MARLCYKHMMSVRPSMLSVCNVGGLIIHLVASAIKCNKRA